MPASSTASSRRASDARPVGDAAAAAMTAAATAVPVAPMPAAAASSSSRLFTAAAASPLDDGAPVSPLPSRASTPTLHFVSRTPTPSPPRTPSPSPDVDVWKQTWMDEQESEVKEMRVAATDRQHAEANMADESTWTHATIPPLPSQSPAATAGTTIDANDGTGSALLSAVPLLGTYHSALDLDRSGGAVEQAEASDPTAHDSVQSHTPEFEPVLPDPPGLPTAAPPSGRLPPQRPLVRPSSAKPRAHPPHALSGSQSARGHPSRPLQPQPPCCARCRRIIRPAVHDSSSAASSLLSSTAASASVAALPHSSRPASARAGSRTAGSNVPTVWLGEQPPPRPATMPLDQEEKASAATGAPSLQAQGAGRPTPPPARPSTANAAGRGGRTQASATAAAAESLCPQCQSFLQSQARKNEWTAVASLSATNSQAMLQLHVPDEKDSPNLPTTVSRFNQPLVGKQMRGKMDGSGAAGDTTNMQNPLVPLAAYAVASFVPSPLGSNGDRGLAAALSSARDQRALCVALADAEKLAFARGVEIQLLQRELARAEQLQEHLSAELASTRELSARVSDGAAERVRMLSEARAATVSSESAATALRNEHALLHEEYASLKSVFGTLHHELDQMSREHKENTDANMALRAERDQAQSELAAARAELDALKPVVARLTSEREEVDAETAALRRSFAEQLRELESLRPQHTVAVRRAGESARRAEDQAVEIILLRTELTDLKGRYADAQRKIVTQSAEIDRMQTERLASIAAQEGLAVALRGADDQAARDQVLRTSHELEARAMLLMREEERKAQAIRDAEAEQLLASVRAELATARLQADKTAAALQVMEAAKDELVAQLETARSAAASTELNVAATAERITKLKKKLREAEAGATLAEEAESQARNQVQLLLTQRSQAASLHNEVARARTRAEDAVTRLKKDIEGRSRAYAQQVESLRTRMELAQSEAASLRASRAEETAERRADVFEAAQAASRAAAAHERIAKLQAKLSALQAEHAKCPGAAAQTTQWRQKAQAAEARAATAQAKVAAQQRLVSVAQSEAAKHAARSSSEIAARKEVSTALSHAQGHLRAQRAAAEAAQNLVNHAKGERDSERARATALAKEHARTKRLLSDAQRDKDAVEERLGGELQLAREATATLRSQAHSSQTKLDAAQATITALQAKAAAAAAEAEAAEAQAVIFKRNARRDAHTRASQADESESGNAAMAAASSGTSVPASFQQPSASSSAAVSRRSSTPAVGHSALPRSGRSSGNGTATAGWGIQLVEFGSAEDPVALGARESLAFRAEAARVERERLREQVVQLSAHLLEARADKAELQNALDQSQMAQHDAEARVREHIQRTSEAQAALATLKEQTELQSIERAEQEQHARDELERQSAEQAASFAARVFDAELRVADLTNQLASASSALAAEQQRATETATAHAFELDSLRARLLKTEQRASDAQALVQQLTAKVREMIAAKQRDRDAEIAIEQASLLRDGARGQSQRGDDFALIAGGGPDVHQLYRVARAQLARTTEAAAKADERHEHALRALDKAHKKELAAAEETKQTLLSQLSSLRVAHGAELARVEASLARVHVRAAQAAALYASIRPQLGLTFLADVPSVARHHGLLVTAVSAGLGAAKAGIRIGDVIEDIAGAQVRSAAEVTRALEQVRAGQQCMLYVRRVSEGEPSAPPSTTADSLPSDAGAISGEAAARVEYLSFSVLTSSSQFTAHQLTVLRRLSPVDASGITSARNLDDEQLLDLMLSNAGFRAGVTVPAPLLTSGVRTVAGGAPQAQSRRRSLRQEEKEREETAQANTDATTSTHAEATPPQAVVQ